MTLSEYERPTDRVQITEEFIEAAKTPRGGWNAKQLAAVGIAWPPKHGWRRRLVGKWITQEDAERFYDLGKSGKKPAATETKPALKAAALDYVTAAYARAYEMAKHGDVEAGCIADDLEKAIAILRAAK
ncbi:hypothetical protein ABNQ39_20455 [Azospirillum sp. A26]|uniref:hypothetical protein n=1 Tax=Azospirillum sp. A26 TaxID=3160607 RepID=UPI003670A195